MDPIEVLFEEPNLPSFSLPERLAKLYGGSFGFHDDRVFANFVASIDGVTAIPDEDRSSALISGGSQADRLVMGMLRAAADVVVIGAGTLRAHPRSTWTSADAFDELAEDFAEMRTDLGRERDGPRLVVVTGSGRLDGSHPGLAKATVLTTPSGADALPEDISSTVLVVDAADRAIPPAAALEAIRGRGARSILVEGGPHLLGEFVAEGLVDELFLTVSPVLAGRADAGRPGLLAGVELLPQRRDAARLISVREHDSYLLLRYLLRR